MLLCCSAAQLPSCPALSSYGNLPPPCSGRVRTFTHSRTHSRTPLTYIPTYTALPILRPALPSPVPLGRQSPFPSC